MSPRSTPAATTSRCTSSPSEESINVWSGDTYVPQNGYIQNDNFNRAALGSLWSAPGNFTINANRLRAGGSGGSGFTGSALYTSPFGGVNAQVTLTQLPSGSTSYVGLMLKASAATNPTSYLYLRYRAGQVSLVCHGTSTSNAATACRNNNGTVVGSAGVHVQQRSGARSADGRLRCQPPRRSSEQRVQSLPRST